MGSGSEAVGLDQDVGGGGVAEREPATVDHTNKRTASADLGHEGALSKPHLTNALAKRKVAADREHAARLARRELAERQGLGMKTVKVRGHMRGTED